MTHHNRTKPFVLAFGLFSGLLYLAASMGHLSSLTALAVWVLATIAVLWFTIRSLVQEWRMNHRFYNEHGAPNHRGTVDEVAQEFGLGVVEQTDDRSFLLQGEWGGMPLRMTIKFGKTSVGAPPATWTLQTRLAPAATASFSLKTRSTFSKLAPNQDQEDPTHLPTGNPDFDDRFLLKSTTPEQTMTLFGPRVRRVLHDHQELLKDLSVNPMTITAVHQCPWLSMKQIRPALEAQMWLHRTLLAANAELQGTPDLDYERQTSQTTLPSPQALPQYEEALVLEELPVRFK